MRRLTAVIMLGLVLGGCAQSSNAPKPEQTNQAIILSSANSLSEGELNAATEALIAAIEQNDKTAFTTLLASSVSQSLNPKDGYSPLYSAITMRRPELVKPLLDAGANPNLGNQYSGYQTPLMFAIFNVDIDSFKQLLASGANPNGVDYKGLSALHYLAQSRCSSCLPRDEFNQQALALLIEHGANINQQNNEGESPAFVAAKYNNIPMLTALAAQDADLDLLTEDGFSALIQAIDFNQPKIVSALLDLGADVNAKTYHDTTPLMDALLRRESRQQIIDNLIAAGADVNSHGAEATPLVIAVESNNIELVNQLVAAGADPSLATLERYTTPLMSAIYIQSNPMIERLLQLGANPNQQDIQGASPLRYAIGLQNQAAVELLLKAGADINELTKQHWTPLATAIDINHLEIATLLLAKGADINISDSYGDWPPIVLASSKLDSPMLSLLMDNGADIKRTNLNGNNALHIAVLNIEQLDDNAKQVITALINYGADLKAVNNSGKTALDYADSKPELLQFLQQF
ncbi:ankyrin repeat domain-containing protein [Shewanella sp. 1CM18E]|uniref:ankyrin repeat domain-containing protein n=1 Tax=Shewanella sp. 1CM18E TaxID=2929169 RepID=UPI0020C189E8|nr:ankyrin repeat domain-containing protein [Shewanella sp. 1CM18E]